LDRTGLLAKILQSAYAIEQGRKWLDTEGQTEAGRVSYRTGLTRALEAFKEAQASAAEYLESLILAEYTFLGQELQFCLPSDTKTIKSLTAALQSFDEALIALKEVESASSYNVVDRCFSHRQEYRVAGMPKDAFHVASVSHKARLDNSLRSPSVNANEKNLLKQRLSNIVTAQAVYLAKQKKALSD
jgi:hypothetical protein